MKKLLPLTLLTFLLLTTAHALFFAGRSVSNYRSIGGIKIDKMGGKTTGIKKINGINFRKKVFDPTEGLVGWWKFDGDATDASGNGNDGTVYGATLTTDRKGNSDGAYSFDGNDSITLSNAMGSWNKITTSFWMKKGPISGTYRFLGMSQNYNGFFGVREMDILPGRMYYSYGYGSNMYVWSAFSSGSVKSDNLYHHYAIVWDYDSSKVMLFIDGELFDTRSLVHNGNPALPPAQKTLYVGSYNGSSKFLQGEIDDVRIYNRALTSEEIQLLYEKY